MANKYYTLIGGNEIREEYQKIEVDKDISLNKARILNLINNPDGTKDLEIVDARHSTAKGKIFETLDARLEEAEQDHKTHQAETVSQVGGVHGLSIEEGIWTPLLKGNTVAGNNTYSRQIGTYCKVGKMVTLSFEILLSGKDTNMDGSISITGVPFTAKSGFFGLNIGVIEQITMPTGFTVDYCGYLVSVSIALRALSNGSWNTINAENIYDLSRMYGSVTYFTN